MVKAFYIVIAANLAAAAVFFTSGILSENALLNLCGWIFVTASLILLIFMNVMRRRLAKLQAQHNEAA
jgi:Na+/melibiose symporter-like transporter